MKLAQTIKEQRLRKQLSQAEVAHRAKVSLATLQNIEADRANPSWQTVEALGKVLGFQISLQTRQQTISWPELAHFGCPILPDTEGATKHSLPIKSDLVDLLKSLSGQTDKIPKATKESKALVAWLCAIKDHYPSVWGQAPKDLHSWLNKNVAKELSPKLRRIALARLGEFL